MGAIDCGTFDARLEELALGQVPEPEQSTLVAHAAGCARCRRALDDHLVIVDRLLHLAPEHEPPPGFENRVLDRFDVGRSPDERRTPTRAWLVAAALVLVAAGIAVAARAVGDRDAPSAGDVVRSGEIVNGAGERTGEIQLVDAARPFALVTIDAPRDRGGRVSCELELADGSTVEIGSWGYGDVSANIWAVGIDDELLDAVTMRIRTEAGEVVATAALD